MYVYVSVCMCVLVHVNGVLQRPEDTTGFFRIVKGNGELSSLGTEILSPLQE